MSQQDRELAALGRAIRQAREEQGMTPAELASAAGIEREQLEVLEAGRFARTDELLPALAAGLRIDPGMFGYVDVGAVCAAFGRRLRRLRTERGLSQDALAHRTGFVNRTSISTCERGGSDPKLTTIERFARGLRVRPRELLEDEPIPEPLTPPEGADASTV